MPIPSTIQMISFGLFKLVALLLAHVVNKLH